MDSTWPEDNGYAICENDPQTSVTPSLTNIARILRVMRSGQPKVTLQQAQTQADRVMQAGKILRYV
jgi:hypothetical protein